MVTKNLTHFLNQLEDVELAYFYKYRFNDFLVSSKEKILNEFIKRKIDPDNCDHIIEKQVPKDVTTEESKFICLRCKSGKYYVKKEKKLWMNDEELMIEFDDYKYVCLVCGNIEEERSKPIKTIINLLKNIFTL